MLSVVALVWLAMLFFRMSSVLYNPRTFVIVVVVAAGHTALAERVCLFHENNLSVAGGSDSWAGENRDCCGLTGGTACTVRAFDVQ